MEQSRPKWTGSSLQIFRRWSFRYRSLQHPLRQWWVPVSFYAFSMVSFQPIRHKACKYEINLANSKCALDLIASPPEPFDVGHLPRSIIPEHRVTKKQKQYPDRLERPGSTVQHAPFFSARLFHIQIVFGSWSLLALFCRRRVGPPIPWVLNPSFTEPVRTAEQSLATK